MKKWERYEVTAQEILNQLREHFSLGEVHGKQVVKGLLTETEWEIDVIGKSVSNERLVVIECRLTKERQSQSEIAALAFTIKDIGAERGIIVTPHPLQKGAELVAKYSGILHFRLDPRSVSDDFLAQTLGQLFLGIPSIGDTSNFGSHGIRRS